jgi:molybdopterin converting factor subunit 1
MRVHVLYFGIVRERIGLREEDVELSTGSTVADLAAVLSARHGDLAAGVATLRLAVNLEYVGPETVLRDDDEVAVIPPVSGGVMCS